MLEEVDQWFASCVQQHQQQIFCTRGCSSCCRGLFDITLLDALYLRSGFDLLPKHVQQQTQLKANSQLIPLSKRWPAFTAPWILNRVPESEWDDMMPEDDETPCSLLSEDGFCLVYSHRPMTCRLNGIPLIDSSGKKFFDEWCTLNFVDQDPVALKELRHPFYDLFSRELLLFQEMTRRHLGETISELDTLIPAAVFIDLKMVNEEIRLKSRDW
ncbi:MAG TPA: YkgJ family cysteine cluster protein [Desulfuromonadaceae bacterium]